MVKHRRLLMVEPVDVHYDARFDMEYNWHNHVLPCIPENHTPITVFNTWGGIRGWRFVLNPASGASAHV